MQVTLTPHCDQLLRPLQRSDGLGQSPQEIIERTIEAVAQQEPALTHEEQERRSERR